MQTRFSLPGRLERPGHPKPVASRVGVVGWLTLFLAGMGGDQEPGRIYLKPPEVLSSTQFTKIISIRELSDGRVLIADSREDRIAVVDSGAGEVKTIGRLGDGPGEYRGIGRFYPLAGDSSLLTDPYNYRWFLLDGPTIIETYNGRRPVNFLFKGALSGSDRFGQVLGVTALTFPEELPRTLHLADSLVLLLGNIESDRLDTIAHIKGLGSADLSTRPDESGEFRALITRNPLVSNDQALLFPDGWIALARLEPFRVDWRTPDGHWNQNIRLDSDPIRVGDAEKCEAIRRFLPSQVPCEPSSLAGWPRTMPPFLPSRLSHPTLLASPEGYLVIARTPTTASSGTTYDFVDREGILRGTLVLEPNVTLIGFGRNSAYTLATDELDLQTLRRHPWPGLK